MPLEEARVLCLLCFLWLGRAVVTRCEQIELGESKKTNVISAKDRDVIVIGGGDTGTDCVATALRGKDPRSYSAMTRRCIGDETVEAVETVDVNSSISQTRRACGPHNWWPSFTGPRNPIANPSSSGQSPTAAAPPPALMNT